MGLADFIPEKMETILQEWEAFAATLLPAARNMNALALRDHAQPILEAVVKDIRTGQTAEEQMRKSKGWTTTAPNAPATAAETHAVLRARSGFDINQLVAEYRALRASVLRLWAESSPLDEPAVEEVIRFNEAIDQAITESVNHFHIQTERARNLLLGMLGHDMRTPLSAIVSTASFLADLNAGEEVSRAAKRLIHSGASMQALLDDLVDFNRTQLGLGIKVFPSEVDLAAEIAEELDQMRAAHPSRPIELVVAGNTRGRWDHARLKQVLRNLVCNAIKYGSPESPVRVTLAGEESEARLEISNRGEAIDPDVLAQLFQPLKRGLAPPDIQDARDGLGLGLFIVREIVQAHGGVVDVRSQAEETVFSVHLPRSPGSGER